MKLLITGAGGQVGQALMRACANAEIAHVGLTRQQLDITRADDIKAALAQVQPDFVINAAAISDVRAAQADALLCYQVNRDGAALLAKACTEYGIGLVYLSTDYVFDGQSARPYRETTRPDPQNVYGNSKYEGEQAVREYCPHHLIVRTSWVFSAQGNNFFTRVLDRARAGETVTAVDDQISSPTWSGHLAQVCIAMLQQVHCQTEPELWGTYHYCDRGPTSRCDFARTILTQATHVGEVRDWQVEAIDSKSLGLRAETPRQSVLLTEKLFFTFGIQQRRWRRGVSVALDQYLAALRDTDASKSESASAEIP